MNYSDFKAKYAGKGIDFDGYYGFQCMDLIEQYNQEVVNAPRLGGNAADVWDNYPKDFYNRIENTPSGVPEQGDIVIWNRNAGGGFGHAAIFDSGDVSKFQSLDQNWPIGSVTHLQDHSYTNVLGWLHPKKETEPAADITQRELDEIRKARDDHWNDLQNEIKKNEELTNKNSSLLVQNINLTNEIKAKEKTIIDLSAQLHEQMDTISDLQKKLQETQNKALQTMPNNWIDRLAVWLHSIFG